jgi:mRNA interferase RelE/StbE
LSYEVRIVRSAEKEMNRFPPTVRVRLSKKALSLEDNPRPRGVKKLSGWEEYRLRVGDYRILYIINDREHIITILAVSHRREAYS